MSMKENLDKGKNPFLKAFDLYLESPSFGDFLVVVFFNIIIYKIDKWVDLKVDFEIVKTINSDLIGNSISLVGFVLAALTIIITFKENTKTYHERDIKRDLKKGVTFHFFGSKHYSKVVRIFYGASFELLFVFISSVMLKFFIPMNLGIWYNYILMALMGFMCLTVLRCLVILYLVIKMQIGSE